MADLKDKDQKVNSDNEDDSGTGGGSFPFGKPSTPSAERLPNVEKSSKPEKEKAPEAPDSVNVPTPLSRKKKKDKKLKTPKKSESKGRVVDKRKSASKKQVPLDDAKDDLTRYGDDEEGKFIEGVTSAHESDES